MLRVKNLSYSYNGQVSFSFPDIELSTGGSLLIVGKSGVGKSTFLHLLGGIISTSIGEINISGTDLTKLSRSQINKFRGKHIGFIFQKPHLINALSVLDNLKLAQYFNNFENEKRIEEVLKENGLFSKKNKKPYTLSQGEQQRLAIARGILNEPKVILADEPTSALDDENAHMVAKLLTDQAAKYKANLVIATHDQRLRDLFPDKILLK